MTRPEVLPVPPTEEEEQDVLDFLHKTPDFFIRHADILAEMPIRHGSGGAVSLIERQVRVIRDKNHQLNTRLEGLLQTARQNESRVNGMNRLAESLIQADSQAAVVASLSSVLHAEFAVEAARIALFDPPAAVTDPTCIALSREALPAGLKDFFRQGQVVCGALDEAVRVHLFGDHAELKSVALVPLDRADCLGLLALASTDPEQFSPNMGNLFLEMTANLCTAALRFHGAGQA
jgi:uncharacterized protein YigA (DUF484 family)